MSQDDQQTESLLRFRRFALAVCVIGVLVQLGLTSYYLAMGHKAQPRHLPVGLVTPAAKRDAVVDLLSQNDYFKITDYATADDLMTAIKRRDVYGGVDITTSNPHLYVGSAAGPAAASLLRSTYTTVVQQQTAAALTDLAKAGETMKVSEPQDLN